MAILASELKQWAATLADDDAVAIDEGGMLLVVQSCDAYIEVGGIPEDEEWEVE